MNISRFATGKRAIYSINIQLNDFAGWKALKRLPSNCPLTAVSDMVVNIPPVRVLDLSLCILQRGWNFKEVRPDLLHSLLKMSLYKELREESYTL